MQPIDIIIEIFCIYFHANSLKFSVNFALTACFILKELCVCWTPPPHLELHSRFFPAHSQLTTTLTFSGFFTTAGLSSEAFTHAVPSHPSLLHYPVLSHLSLNFKVSPSVNLAPVSLSTLASLCTWRRIALHWNTHFNLSL